jgi:hypothetical protein
VGFLTVGTTERDGVAAAGDGFVIPSLDASLVTASVLVAAMTSGADGAGRMFLLA